jgi:hypothetical protein
MRLTSSVAVAIVACGGGTPAPDFGAPSATFPAELPPIPQVVKGSGTPMTNVHVVPVFFGSDDEQPMLEDFLNAFAAGSDWPTMVSEYGVDGGLVIDPSVIIADVPTTFAEFETAVQATFGSADAATIASTVYMFHFSADELLTTPFGCSCVDFAGFHAAVPQAAGSGSGIPNVTSALSWGCSTTITELDEFDVATIVMSHELVEAATDPVPNTAWGNVDLADSEWALHFGGEVGDMCEGFPRRLYEPADVGFFIQRTWSNAAATGFHDPCVPHIPGDPAFFATRPVEPDLDNGVRATNVELPDGEATIDLEFISDGPTGAPWIVEPLDEATLDGAPPALELSLDRNSGQNGDIAHLTIKPASGATKGLTPYRLLSTLGGYQEVWFGVVDLKASD